MSNKISDAILQLEEIKRQHGDVDVYVLYEGFYQPLSAVLISYEKERNMVVIDVDFNYSD